MTTLSYSVTEPALRSPIEEWQPHGKQSQSIHEWWYVTAVVHDVAGNADLLAWCPFHFTGEKTVPMSAGLPRDQRASAALTDFTACRDTFHIGRKDLRRGARIVLAPGDDGWLSRGLLLHQGVFGDDQTEDLKKFDVPTLILQVDDDQIVP
jgi:hypothetical protein